MWTKSGVHGPVFASREAELNGKFVADEFGKFIKRENRNCAQKCSDAQKQVEDVSQGSSKVILVLENCSIWCV